MEKTENTEQTTVVKSTDGIGKNYTHNNIPKVSTQENLPTKSVNFADTNQTVQHAKQKGGFTSFSGKGKLKGKATDDPANDNNRVGGKLKSMLKKALSGMGRIRNSEQYIQKSLMRMGVKGQEELYRYHLEIMHSVQNKQMQSINGCLWLIEQGRWKAPAGMY